MKKSYILLILFIGVLSFLFGILVTSNHIFSHNRVSSRELLPMSSRESQKISGASSDSSDKTLGIFTFRRVSELRKPTVVNISTKRLVKSQTRVPRQKSGEDGFFFNFFGKDFFRFFYPREYTQQSLGSGVIVGKEGYILTNNHVIEDADEVIVRLLNNDKKYKATVAGRDPKTDLALLKINGANNLSVAALGDSSKLHVGDWVIAIGNPFGYSHTVTVGVVSALDRSIGQGPYDQYIQTDASINPGNSGGPLFNHEGKVIGINTAIATRSGGFQGIGFAIPINIAKKILPQLKSNGKVTRGWLGVSIQRVDTDLAEKFGLDKPHGALVSSVFPGTPAEKAGIKQGDIIVEFNGEDVKSFSELSRFIADAMVGSKVKITIFRDGKKKAVSVTLGKYPDNDKTDILSKNSQNLGIEIQELNPSLSSRLGIPSDTQGVVITNVKAGSTAEDAGLSQGDVIVSIEKKKIHNSSEFYKAIDVIKHGKKALFLIQRGPQTLFIMVLKK